MQLSAPRQGLFALALFISFILHAFFTIYSIRTHQADVRDAQATLLLNQVSQEFAPTVLAKDTIGLSLLAKRYAHQQSINSLTVTAKDGTTLSKVGQAQTRQGETFSRAITVDKDTVGEITLNLAIPSRGDVIAGQWLLFLASALLHLGLWLCYRLFASQFIVLDALMRPQRQHVGTQKPLPKQPPAETSSTLSSEAGLSASTEHTHTQTSQAATDSNTSSQRQPTGFSATGATSLLHDTEPNATGMTSFLRALGDASDPIILQIQFDDPKTLLTKLSPSIATPYYSLCDKLLDNAIDELSFSGHIAKGIHFEKTAFAEDGVHIVATHAQDVDQGTDTHKADVAYACMMLAKLYMLLHEVTYIRHREINRFALETKACISRKTHQPAMAQMLEYEAKANAILLLLNTADVDQLKGNIQLLSYPNPTTVLQRKVGIVDGMSQRLIRPLVTLRDKVLAA